MLMRLKIILGTLCPSQRHLHGSPYPVPLRWMFRAFIKSHDDVCPQRNLDFHGPFRRKQVRCAVNMRAKTHAFLAHFAQLAQAEYLEAAGIRKQSAVPAHKSVQPPHFAHQLMPRPQIKMISIAQNDLRAQILQNILRDGLYGSRRAHRHKSGSLYRTMRSLNARQSGRTGLSLNCERQGHASYVTGFLKFRAARNSYCEQDVNGLIVRSLDVIPWARLWLIQLNISSRLLFGQKSSTTLRASFARPV